MGSAPISCDILESLAKSRHQLVGVVTQPDRPRGRGGVVAPSPVRVLAEGHGFTVLTPERVNQPDSLDAIARLSPDVALVVAYGQLLGTALLSVPRLGCINLHTSLLPRWRGAAPVQRAIAAGDTRTGVTLIQMNEVMDAGDILAVRDLAIGGEDTAASLLQKLGAVGRTLVVETLDRLETGVVHGLKQDEALITFAPKLRKEEGEIDWTHAAVDLYNRIRAFNPWPLMACPLKAGARLLVYRAAVELGMSGVPGTVLSVDEAGPVIATGQDALRLLDLQVSGRRRMDGAAFLRGYRLQAGARLSD